jgi:hypothetical protein
MSTVEVKGAVQLRRSLRKYAPDLAKSLKKEITSYLKPVVSKSRSYIPSTSPLSGWSKPLSSTKINYRPFPKFNYIEGKRGIGYTTVPPKPNKAGFTYLAQIYNASATGAIYETAGRLNPWGSPKSKSSNKYAGRQFIQALPAITRPSRASDNPSKDNRKMSGRVIFRAWSETNGQVTPKVINALIKAKNLFDARKNKVA